MRGLTPIEFYFPAAGSTTTTATFTLTLNTASPQPVTVSYATVNGTAVASTDYVAQTGMVTFAPGQTQATIPVPVLADPLATRNLCFTVDLSDPINATLAGTGKGQGTIQV